MTQQKTIGKKNKKQVPKSKRESFVDFTRIHRVRLLTYAFAGVAFMAVLAWRLMLANPDMSTLTGIGWGVLGGIGAFVVLTGAFVFGLWLGKRL